MTTWLEFRVEDENCPHEIDVYDGCPLCRIVELESQCKQHIKSNGRLRDTIEKLQHNTTERSHD